MSRKPFIAGNWKMNMTAASGAKLIEDLKPLVKDANCDVALCVPAILIPAMVKAAAGSNIKIGAENVHWAPSGAYTGEISAEMLKEYGVEYVIIGHSERRQYFGETDESVNMRLHAALKAGLTPIVCVIGTGKTATDEQAQETIAHIRKKIGELFCPMCAQKVIIQYGGSMNAKNCKGLMAQPDIDGGLIGGASLKLDFATIVNYDK